MRVNKLKYFFVILTFFILNTSVFSMSLKTENKTNALPVFVESYSVGLILFENNTGSSNYNYLSVSLPLMIKEELKKTTDIFVDRKDILLEKESIDWDRPWRDMGLIKTNSLMPYYGIDGKNFTGKSLGNADREKKLKASLRKKLKFSSDVIVKNDQTMDEIAKTYKYQYILYGSFNKTDKKHITVNVYFYNVMRGLTVKKITKKFKENRVLIDLKYFSKLLRSAIINYPVTSLKIETEPADVMIYLDGNFIGRSPKDIKVISATNHKVFLKKDGYKSKTLEISLKTNHSYKLKTSLIYMPQNGAISINSDPQGATVYIDLAKKGKTPLIVTNMKAADYRLTMELDKYHKRYVRINVKNNKTNSLFLTLKPVIKGELTIDAKVKRSRMWMNISFWTGAASLVTYAFLYFQSEDFLNQYYQTDDSGYSDRYVKYRNAANVALYTSLGAFAVSVYFLIDYLIKDDRELGFNMLLQQKTFFASASYRHVSFHWRF
ncbi:MAG: PEGA domain-containing protein [Spirochaetes bacterium]|nr:PEGA domain-containing protein [Spirochaetota bacterium]